MPWLIDLFAENQLLLLFTVIGLGYLLGNLNVRGFSLGVAAVLFVGIAAGALDPRLALPEHIYIIGLVLFVYAIGLQSGPGFFASFRKRGLRINLVAIALLTGGAGTALVLWRLLGLSVPSLVGLFCGALTNTPALAATVETVKHLTHQLPPEQASLYANAPVVAYGLAYPFGVLGVILWFFIFTRVFGVDFAREEHERLMASKEEVILRRTYKVSNPAIIGKTVQEVIRLLEHPGFVFSRIRQNDTITVVAPDTVLAANDQIIAVGNAAAQERAQLLLGERSKEDLAEQYSSLSYRRIFVSHQTVVGRTVGSLNLQKLYHATITRLRRGDVDFVPSPETTLELGDRIRVVAPRDQLARVTDFFGDSIKSISETDFLSLSLGIVLGAIAGMIPLPLPNGMTFKLGFAGGPLIVALILGRLQRTGPITWGLPFTANLALRQTGLVLFLAAIGTKAGYGVGGTFQGDGWKILAAGATITSCVSVATIIVGYKFLKLPMSAVMGMMSGIQTQPACLAYSNQQAKNELPNVWYATVFPASMVTKIILAQLLVSLLLAVK